MPEQPLRSFEPALGSRPGDGAKAPHRGNPPAATIAPPIETGARKADVAYRQRQDRDARELEQPIDRLEMIRRAARKLAARPAAAPRIPAGIPTERAPIALPANPAEARLARVSAAIAFLKARGVIVQVINRDALVREYRISGSTHRYFAEGVIAYAARQGFVA